MKSEKFMKKKKILYSLITAMSIILAYILYVNAVVNADDTGTYVYMYNYFELGSINLSLKKFLNPWFISSAIAYLLNIGGTGSTISIIYLAVWYGIAVFLTLTIINNAVTNKWLLILAFFILIPNENTNRYHMFVTLISLFSLLCIQLYDEDKKRKWLLLVALLALVYTLLFADDKALLILYAFATAMVYYGIMLLQDKSKRKILYMIGFAVVLLATIIKCIDNIFGLGISGEWGGYGGSEYLTWINVETLFEKGIPSFFNSLLIQWNVPASGGMIQLNSFYWIVRIGIAILAIIAVISQWIKIVKIGLKNMDITDALSVTCFTVVACVNTFNGMVEYYEISSTPLNRYASICWFLLIIILVRWVEQKCTNIELYKNISSNLLMGIIFAMLSVGYIGTTFKINNEVINSYCLEEIKYLKGQGDSYKYGLSSFWKSSPIDAATNSEYMVCKGWVRDGKLVCDSPTQYANYLDGTNYFNFIISDPSNEMTVSAKNINELRPDYIGTTRTMYLYDYDIRFDTRLVMECWEEDGDYELTDDITYNLEFPVGTNRIHLEVGNSDNFNISLENEIYVDLVCTQNTNVVVNIGRLEDEYTTIHKICLKRVRASITVDENVTDYSQKIFLKEGSYVITFDGTDIKNMQVEWSGTDISVDQLTNGKIKRRYQIDVTTPQTVELNISGSDNMVIDKISYENAVLFDEDEE
jgi:hypothetical protein